MCRQDIWELRRVSSTQIGLWEEFQIGLEFRTTLESVLGPFETRLTHSQTPNLGIKLCAAAGPGRRDAQARARSRQSRRDLRALAPRRRLRARAHAARHFVFKASLSRVSFF